jgi:hypothetical protein
MKFNLDYPFKTNWWEKYKDEPIGYEAIKPLEISPKIFMPVYYDTWRKVGAS